MKDFYRQTPATQALLMAEFARRSLREWNIGEADIALLKLRENAVFRIDVPQGRSFVMRIHRYNYHSDRDLLSELQWLQALARSGIEAPGIIPSAGGRLFEVVRTEAVPEPRQVDLLGWLSGEPMGAFWETSNHDSQTLTDNFRLLGKLAARVHNQAVEWHPPPGFSRHHWDADGIAGAAPFWGRFWELDDLSSSQRRLLERARERVHADLMRLEKSPETYSLIHADLVPENILVDGQAIRLIDFDDAGFGWHPFEIATALISHLGRPYYERVRDALIAGYREHRSFDDALIEQLPLFFLARSFTYLAWAHTRFETELAQKLTPSFVETGCSLADAYLSG